MGMEQTVVFPAGSPVCWPAARRLLASHGFPVQVRMIDGELAFPDEEPPANWHELRLATAEGLAVTVRRESNRVVFVVWGNADAKLVQGWNALVWAFAETGSGQIHTADKSYTPTDYRSQFDLPASLRSDLPDDPAC